MKKILFILILFLSCYIIYNLTTDNKINYLTIGDFLSEGLNVYGIKQYGYSDYVKDYFEYSDRLKSYDNSFVEGDYRITDLIRMIKYNETKNVNGREVSINQLLKQADIITLSIGMNDLYYKLNINNDNVYNYMNGLLNDMEKLLGYINRFNHKKVFILGYYNVGVEQDSINYINTKLKYIVTNEGFEYVDLANFFDNNPNYFDNSDSFIPNNEGYLKISKIIIEKLKNY